MKNKSINIKKNIILAAVLFAICFGTQANAQISIRFNIGVQPIWGPVGYDYAEYYYIPDIEAYYNVSTQEYVYYDGYRWVTMRNLPPRYSNFDLYRAHKVVINDPSPWTHNDRYRKQYYQYRGRHDQQAIRNSHDDRYRENPNHPEHNQWRGNNGRGNGNGRDQRRDQGRGRDQRYDQGRGQDQRREQGREQGRGQDQMHDRGRGQDQRQGQGREQGRGQDQRQGQGQQQGREQGKGHGEGHGNGKKD